MMAKGRNVLGTELEICCGSPATGFYRDGTCRSGPDDLGVHAVCVRVTLDFLEYGRAQGNDLITPVPWMGFPGLRPGQRWCVCVARWKEALDAGVAPPVILGATHEAALEFVSLADLKRHAIDLC
jgi:uncharacterized protein (DUF2237 family)